MAEQIKNIQKPVKSTEKRGFPFSLMFGLIGLLLGIYLLIKDKIGLGFEIQPIIIPILLIIMGLLMIKDSITLGRLSILKRRMDRIL
ncbi:MAG: hypothetical protein KAU20_01810 [Nanoarchaeota archaeon]|nr:hypothetical protein [Nanoarchaeota archaeon]